MADLTGFTAMVSFDGNSEDIVTSVNYGTAKEDFGWLMPMPAQPIISQANLIGFTTARRLTTPPQLPRAGAAGPGVAAAANPRGSVEELGRVVVGNVEFVILRVVRTFEDGASTLRLPR